ncbi:hypothetical protein MRBLMC3_000162 [Sphingobium sp. LMC3-1-1.1]|uniref:hypothetical protein n=1 Tax=Sphingobium sp. LMC3-1-1.1 TaxID=3135241 RepID=UPI003422EAB2
MATQIEKLDIRAYRVTGKATYIVRPMKSGRYRWGMFYEGDDADDSLVVMERDTEKQIVAEAVMAAL